MDLLPTYSKLNFKPDKNPNSKVLTANQKVFWGLKAYEIQFRLQSTEKESIYVPLPYTFRFRIPTLRTWTKRQRVDVRIGIRERNG